MSFELNVQIIFALADENEGNELVQKVKVFAANNSGMSRISMEYDETKTVQPNTASITIILPCTGWSQGKNKRDAVESAIPNLPTILNGPSYTFREF